MYTYTYIHTYIHTYIQYTAYVYTCIDILVYIVVLHMKNMASPSSAY